MLAKEKRLNLKKDFRFVASGKRIETPHFKLFFRFGDNEKVSVGIATSSKNFPKSYMRNKAKRKASYTLEQMYSTLPKGLNLVIMPKSSILNIDSKVLIKELEDVKNRFINN